MNATIWGEVAAAAVLFVAAGVLLVRTVQRSTTLDV